MAIAKNPGAGRGAGGGRPRREGEVEEVRLRLSPQVAGQLRDLAEARGVPAWRLVEDLVSQAPKGVPGMETPSLPPAALEIAKEAAAFLAAQEDRGAALAALRRAWSQALALAQAKREMGE